MPFALLIFWVAGRELDTGLVGELLLGGGLLILLALVTALFVYLRRPFNGDLSAKFLRINHEGLWLGAAGEWEAVNLTGEQLVISYLIILKVKRQASYLPVYLWLWADGHNARAHRRLRVQLRQGAVRH
ncbi:hypothetical protein L1F30_08860 [Simiduia sp. 21SJ11W-1]|uniref:protein YgfX n=1 Tax=Simiduia sp. 21SJ11W-1 TaxID=2909669 RepID=UPI0020A01B36|nr:protein YgfX [Simiduia sp. 21SJ11W-1]UTA46293.1 hypothetical protein L1F30_08860 [Simiduia sp. 21SJ11W-1]